MPKTGQTPGEGLYECYNCGEFVELESCDDELPECPMCNGNVFVEVEIEEE